MVPLTSGTLIGYKRPIVHHLIACAACGMDPATDTFVVQSMLAAVIAAPWFFRGQIGSVIARVRGRPIDRPAIGEACPLPGAEDEESPPTR